MEHPRSASPLGNLTTPQTSKALIDLIEHADFSAEALREIRDAVLTRIQNQTPGAPLTLRAEHENRLRAIVCERYQAGSEPSLQMLRYYLRRLEKLGPTNFHEKRGYAQTATYWRKEFNAEFLYYGAPCNLRATTGSSPNGVFQLRSKGKQLVSLYAKVAFPRLQLRLKSSPSNA